MISSLPTRPLRRRRPRPALLTLRLRPRFDRAPVRAQLLALQEAAQVLLDLRRGYRARDVRRRARARQRGAR